MLLLCGTPFCPKVSLWNQLRLVIFLSPLSSLWFSGDEPELEDLQLLEKTGLLWDVFGVE